MTENIELIQYLPYFQSISIIGNGLLDRKQWTFSFKKKLNYGAKILNFGMSELRLLSGSLGADTTALYTMFIVKHLLSRGHSTLFLQVQSWLLEVG